MDRFKPSGDSMIIRFGFYGFFKNLKFFEPYFIIFLLASGMSFFSVGILFGARQVMTYITEIPSGLFADIYGRKYAMILCFVFYIVSFIIFFGAHNFIMLLIAMLLFGLGEAFRTGTHKAIIVDYLRHIGRDDEKTRVYGFTRAMSLVGSSLSAIIAIVLILMKIPVRHIFLISVIPYVIDAIIIITYPSYLNRKHNKEQEPIHLSRMLISWMGDIFRNRRLASDIISSSLYDSVFAAIKDYVQPALMLIFAGTAGISLITGTGTQAGVIIGVFYCIVYILSAITSGNAYRLKRFHKRKIVSVISIASGIMLFAVGIGVHFDMTIIIVSGYAILYMLNNARRPIMVDIITSDSPEERTATVMSAESQLKVIAAALLAPVIGFAADRLGIQFMYIIPAAIMILTINWKRDKG